MSLHLAKRSQARTLSTIDDLCTLLDCKPVVLEQITSNVSAQYRYLAVPKSDGSRREIRPPNYFLKRIQSLLLRYFYKTLRLPSHLHGGLPGRSIVTHAAMHVGQAMVA